MLTSVCITLDLMVVCLIPMLTEIIPIGGPKITVRKFSTWLGLFLALLTEIVI